MFKAYLVEGGSPYVCTLKPLDDTALPEADVTVAVEYSTLNYKDALALTGRSPIARKLPLVPGIDFAGTVERSDDPRFRPGDAVVLTGFGVGETYWGGLSQRARVPGDWLIRLPDGMSTAYAMAFGTAGFTAMLAVLAIEKHGIRPEHGPVLVTGAGGGVGGIAIHLLSRLGYTVAAATGRPEQADYLRSLGASEIVDRASLSAPGKPLARATWAAAIDNAGSHILANCCAATKDDGIVVACGLAQGMDFPGSVAPFILRGITLAGINSVNRSREQREEVWTRLQQLADPAVIAAMIETIGLTEAMDHAGPLLDGQVLGRLVVDTAC
ncbi:MAG: oxidoreductase [Sphingomonadales bacterium]|nr:oxidoreductase [Sphingomonadales bacterium]